MKISTNNAEITISSGDDVIRKYRNVISKIKFLFLHFLEFLDRCLVLMVLIFRGFKKFVKSSEFSLTINFIIQKLQILVQKNVSKFMTSRPGPLHLVTIDAREIETEFTILRCEVGCQNTDTFLNNYRNP